MALDITAQDIILDETTGLQDDDINPALPPHSTNDTLTYLLGLDGPGGLASPEVAFQSDFVIATANAGETITSVILTQNASGTPFSTTVGVNSGIRTVDGNYVWLFQDQTHPNVVIGVIGTSDANASPAASGPLAFSFALMSTATTGHFDLYTVQYVPLFNPIASDPDDRIDLTDKVFASVAGTGVVGFSGQNAAPGNHDFYVINSPDDASKQILVTGFLGTTNATANVSTQGFGVNNQSINPSETLQVDFVTGGNLAAGTASQIQYGSHLENITQAGFTINQITPSNPNLRVDIKISAFNVDNNEQGLNFYDGSPTHAAPITSLSLTGQSGYASAITANGTYPTGSGNVTVSGMGTGVVTITGLDNITTVNITTSSPMDRLTVSGVDANEGCDITEFHFKTTTTNAYTEQVGSFINFDDDGPALSITAAPVVGAAEVVEASGVAGQSQAAITPPTFNASAVDGYTTNVTYALALAGGTATGLLTTVGNHAITLVADSATQISGMYDSNGDTTLDATAFTVTLSGTTVTLTSLVALEHSNAPQGVGEDNTLDLNGLINVTATVTVTDGDQDVVSQQSSSSGLSLTFDDTDPALSITAAPVIAAAAVGEASGAGGQTQATITPPTFNASAVDGYTTAVTYVLALAGGPATGLLTTEGNHPITLVADSGTQISGMYDSDGNSTLDATAFTVTLSGTTVTLTSLVALEHSNAPQGVGEDNTLDLNGLINVVATVTVTDGDNDTVTQQSSTSGGLSLTFNDTDPIITAPFDADPVAGGIQTPEQLGNTVGATASGTFGYDMTDKHTAAEYTAGASDFADQDSVLPGIQLSLGGNLTGLVPNTQTPFISSSATLQSEDVTQATFSWQISYDSDPNTAGDQTATAGGTLVFNKTADTYTITLNDAVEGFTKDILHTSELLSKEPTSNVGHPNIVVEKLFEADSTPEMTDRDFFVQFTANSVTNTIKFGLNSTGDSDNATPTDTAWNPGDLVTNNHEDWVSATQSTNGVAGDTIQKGELLTLRFFDTSPGIGTEIVTPSQTAADMAIKFDGIGTSEDLMVILQLVSSTDSSVHTTKAIYIENADIYKMGQVPTAYAADFPLDNNDGLIIIERNDYNGVGENWVIQGAQIMQSGNGITGDGTAIDLNRATGSGGGSSQTTLVNWDPTDNDVLKIVDLGFTSTQTTTPDAHLDFGVQIADADGDTTAVQHILVDIA
ncbi:DUF5801 domain-containing protein [Mesorhizobium sp. CA10]|uniref:DUF5801 repeats-in-toxin domain-containing protein n=1 Tax=Mesorhizobium sp. CA10 TaxID=588495 RepID=UPI001CD00F4D|nr:DUF5801 repeats-in-toxin domain-containing protein [Mesorhizobium sp. CA10]MBZ9882697.1 DUF5801 domain-containing protein [Mesorhizobium sp. CA10]